MFRSKDDERHIAAVRRLLKVAEQFEQVIEATAPGTPAHHEVADAIADGEFTLKRMGGVATRSARASVAFAG